MEMDTFQYRKVKAYTHRQEGGGPHLHFIFGIRLLLPSYHDQGTVQLAKIMDQQKQKVVMTFRLDLIAFLF